MIQRIFGRLAATALLIAAPLVGGCHAGIQSAGEFLDGMRRVNQVELLALDPAGHPDPASAFEGCQVLGTKVLQGGDKASLVDALAQGIADSTGEEGPGFTPHHGLSYTDGGTTYHVLISFADEQIDVMVNHQRVRKLLTTPKPALMVNHLLSP